MITRLNIGLGLLFGLQIILIALRWLGGDATVAAERGLLLPGLDTKALTHIRIESGSGETSEVVNLRRPDASDPRAWAVEEADGYAADRSKIDDTLRELSALEIADVVTTTGQHDVDLHVADGKFERKVTLEGSGEPVSVVFGTAGRGNSIHARRAGEPSVFAVRDYSSWKLTVRPDAWIDRTYFGAERGRVQRLAITNPKGEMRVEAEGTNVWTVVSGESRATADETKVEELLRRATQVNLTEVAGRREKLELGAPVAEVVVGLGPPPRPATEDGAEGTPAPPAPPAAAAPAIEETRTLRIYPKPGTTDRYYLHADDEPFVGEAMKYAVSALLDAEPSALAPDPAPPAGDGEPPAIDTPAH